MQGRTFSAGGCGGWACQGLRRTACDPAPRCVAGLKAEVALTKQLRTPARNGLRVARSKQHCMRQCSRRRLVCEATDSTRYVSPLQRWRQFKQDVRDAAVLTRERFMCASLFASSSLQKQAL